VTVPELFGGIVVDDGEVSVITKNFGTAIWKSNAVKGDADEFVKEANTLTMFGVVGLTV